MAKLTLIAGGLLMMLTAAASGSNQKLRRLSSSEIHLALPGRWFSYQPPNSFDAGVHEEFHRDGKWKGIRYSRGPVGFEGRWQISGDKICVRASQGSVPASYKEGWFCRQVWEEIHAHRLLMIHLMNEGDLLMLTERPLQD